MSEPEVACAGVFNGKSLSFVINHNDVKPFSEVIKMKTGFLTSKCVEQREATQFFFSEAPDLIM